MDICAILQQVGFLTAEIRVFMTWLAPNIFPSKNGMQLCISNTVLAVYFENSRLYQIKIIYESLNNCIIYAFVGE